ncbi:unnamed protein product, partial [Nesidiocoris tenuis]
MNFENGEKSNQIKSPQRCTWYGDEEFDRVPMPVEGKLSMLHGTVRYERGWRQVRRRRICKYAYDAARYAIGS